MFILFFSLIYSFCQNVKKSCNFNDDMFIQKSPSGAGFFDVGKKCMMVIHYLIQDFVFFVIESG